MLLGELAHLGPRLLDFGLAAQIHTSLSRVSSVRMDTSGTRPYMAPAGALSLEYNVALGYDMNALEFAVKDGKFYGIDLTNYTPDLDYRSLKDAHFPWAVDDPEPVARGDVKPRLAAARSLLVLAAQGHALQDLEGKSP